jgi:hypothetical protein
MRSFLTALYLLICPIIFSQSPYNPRILFLSPGKFMFDPSFEQDIRELSGGISSWIMPPEGVSKHHPLCERITVESWNRYAAGSGAEAAVPLFVAERLLFTMFRGPRNFLVLFDTMTTTGTGDDLMHIADSFDVQHIVYFPVIRLYKENGTGFASMQLRMYDRNTNTVSLIISDKEDWIVEEYEYPELRNDENAITLVHNVSLGKSHRILERIMETNPELVARSAEIEKESEDDMFAFSEDLEEKLGGPEYMERKKELFRVLAGKSDAPYSTSQLETALTATGRPFPTENVFQVLYSGDLTRFIAFGLEPFEGESGAAAVQTDNDAAQRCIDYGIVGMKDTAGTSFNGYIVTGIMGEQGNWYVDKKYYGSYAGRSAKEAQKMLLANLYYWSYFDETGTDPSPAFWNDDPETTPFTFVEKPFEAYKPYEFRSLIAWDRHSPERTSFEYISYVEARHIVREMESFEENFARKHLPAIAGYEADAPSKPLLIYTGERDKVIHPFIAKNGKVFYAVFLESTGQWYRWNYFPEEALEAGTSLTEHAKAKISGLTVFTLEKYLTLREDDFWDNCVLKQSGGEYLFLEKM